MINFKIRFKNHIFISQLLLSLFTPMLAYAGINASDLTTWGVLIDLMIDSLKNPYIVSLIVVSLYNALTDPTTKGFSDSDYALKKTDFKKGN